MTHDHAFSALTLAAEATPPRILNVSRRGMLAGLSGLVVAFSLGVSNRAEAAGFGADGMPNGWRDDPKIFVAIADDGIVTITCQRSDMGQGVRTGWGIIIGDELDADWDKIRIVQADGNEGKYGNQDTDGSRSTRQHFNHMRHAGAAAKLMLVQAAAKQWGVPVEECSGKGHQVVHAKSGKTLGYGALAKAAADLPVPSPETVVLKEPAEFRYIGKGNVGIVDNLAITTGKAVYGMDHKIDGMLHAVVARCPVFGGSVKHVDDSETLKVPGVIRTLIIGPAVAPVKFQPLGGVAVIAKNTWAAMKGRDALKITWDEGPNAGYDSDEFRTTLVAASQAPGKVVRKDGDVDAAMARAKTKLVADYYVPHLVQAPMETPAAIAHVKDDGSCEIWACVQSPQAAHDNVAKQLGLADDKVTVHVTMLGGGFGRKSKPDYVVEAALCSKATGKPVKLVGRAKTTSTTATITRSRPSTSRPASTRRACRSPGCTARPRRRSARSSLLAPTTRCRSSSAWGSSTCPMRSPTCAWRTRRSTRTCASAGFVRCRTSRTPSRRRASSPSARTPPDATRRTTCST